MASQNTGIAIISETWFKARHATAHTDIPGYACFRLDRPRRRSGGVAIYIDNSVKSELCQHYIHREYEALWVKSPLGGSPLFICAVYHPPKPVYSAEGFLNHIESTIATSVAENVKVVLLLAGDFNQLPDAAITALGLISFVNKPTHAGHFLDRIYCSQPLYNNIKLVTSLIRTKHRTIIARPDNNFIRDVNKGR